MNRQAEKIVAGKTGRVRIRVPRQVGGGEARVRILDNRRETRSQKMAQQAADNSPRVISLKTFHGVCTSKQQGRPIPAFDTPAYGRDETGDGRRVSENATPGIASPKAIQGCWWLFSCCCGKKKKKKKKEPTITSPLLTRGEEKFSPVFSLFDESTAVNTEIGSEVDTTDWAQDEPLHSKYKVYSKVENSTITYIALLKNKVVAVSSLSYKDKGGYVGFTDFGSKPPFAGLGSRVLNRLEALYQDRIIKPEGPILGSWVFYSKKYQGFTIDSSVLETVKDYLAERGLNQLKTELENPETHKAFELAQKGIVEIERKALLGGKMSYKH